MKVNIKRLGLFLLSVVALGGAGFFYYNYIQNTPGQARGLKLEGLNKRICGSLDYKIEDQDHCGNRSIYSDVDWGITVYYEIYGIDSIDEAKSIADFIKDARSIAKQDEIPINLKIYLLPRSRANRFDNHKIFEQDI